MDLLIKTTDAVATEKDILRSGLFLLFFIVSVSAQALSVVPPPDINYTDLHKAADECDLEKGRAAVDALSTATKDEEINRLDREGYTPLAYAARGGCIELVKLLIDKGAAADAMDDHTRWTPLLQATDQRHAEVARYLLAHGANVNVKAGFGQTPLTAAILGSVFSYGPKGDRDQTIQALLVSGADVNLQGQFSWTPLMTAVLRGDADLARLLINKGADLAAKDEVGKTALDYAEERGERELRDILKNSRTTTD